MATYAALSNYRLSTGHRGRLLAVCAGWLSLAAICPQTAVAEGAVAPFAATLPAAATGPEGDWYTIHDETKKANSVVRIRCENGQLIGKVIRILHSNRGPNPLCERCDGERQGKPVIGMDILWNLRGKNGTYDGGFVLDPSKGKQYRAKITMRSANLLELRGFIGISVFGRTQLWERVPANEVTPP